jgi:two-component system nitrogen regulation sensor histidine kinase NtrY
MPGASGGNSRVPFERPSRESGEKRRRKWPLVLLAIGIFLLFMFLFWQQAFDPIFRPDTTEQTLLLVALTALIFLLLVTLSVVLLRNILKLFAERRLGVLGSKFRTRMVVGALILSLTPVLFLFMFAYGLMNRSIDRWFSSPVEEMRENSGEVAAMLSSYARDNAHAEAVAIAASPQIRHAFETGNFSAVMGEFRSHEATLQGGFALALVREGKEEDAVAAFHAPEPWVVLRTQIVSKGAGQGAAERFQLSGKEYMLASAPVGGAGRIVVAVPLPAAFSATLKELDASQRKYMELSRQRKLLRRTFMGTLLLLTVLVLFAATWLALFLSKLVTRPVEALAEATHELSRGRLDYRVEVPAADELGDLIQSFNRMAADLESSGRQVEASSRELAAANAELEQRRQHMETILESIPTGVLSLDAERRLTRTNPAFRRIFAAHEARPAGGARPFATGSALRDLFSEEVALELEHLLRKADRMSTASRQMEMALPRARRHVAVTVASLEHDGQRVGYVLVFEDLSDLLQAQRQAAWREVARRVAHEIKNPLTPIAISAERIRRHLERGAPPDAASVEVLRGCADTIGGAVETVRTLVDEFSTLARFPASQPQPASANSIVEGALAMFNGRLENIQVCTELAPDLPSVMADPESMKRALANLVDNAAEAMKDSLVREVHISTGLVQPKEAVEIVVADTGHGVTRELKEKLFLPYFSTKERGTGLGLAIVSRIIEDHHGSIRVEENSPIGARFIVELPLAPEAGAPPNPHA